MPTLQDLGDDELFQCLILGQSQPNIQLKQQEDNQSMHKKNPLELMASIVNPIVTFVILKKKKFPEQGFSARCVRISGQNCIYQGIHKYILPPKL